MPGRDPISPGLHREIHPVTTPGGREHFLGPGSAEKIAARSKIPEDPVICPFLKNLGERLDMLPIRSRPAFKSLFSAISQQAEQFCDQAALFRTSQVPGKKRRTTGKREPVGRVFDPLLLQPG